MTRTDRMTCEEVFQRLDDYLDRELTPDEARMVKEHLDTCAACAAEHRFEDRLLNDVKQKLRRLAAPPSLLARVQAAIARAESDAR